MPDRVFSSLKKVSILLAAGGNGKLPMNNTVFLQPGAEVVNKVGIKLPAALLFQGFRNYFSTLIIHPKCKLLQISKVSPPTLLVCVVCVRAYVCVYFIYVCICIHIHIALTIVFKITKTEGTHCWHNLSSFAS